MDAHRGSVIRILSVLAVLCFSPNAFAKTPGKTNAGLVFDKASPSVRLSGKPPLYIYAELRRVSSDGKYVARLTGRDAEAGYLVVYKNIPGRKRLVGRNRVSPEYDDVNGCAWVPHHGHWLLVSTGGADYGEGLLALWTGKGRTRILRRAKTPEADGFFLQSVSADGRRIGYWHYYEHFPPNSPTPDYERNERLHLVLPRS